MTEKPKLTDTGFPEPPETSLEARFLAGRRSKKATSDLGRTSAAGALRAPSFDRLKERERLTRVQDMLDSAKAEIRIVDNGDSVDPRALLSDGEAQTDISDLLGEGAQIRRERLEKNGGNVTYVSQGLKRIEHGPKKGSYRLLIQNERGGQTNIDPNELAGLPSERDVEAGSAWRLELPELPK